MHSVGSQQAGSRRAEPEHREHARWACGDYAVIGTTFQIVSENLAEFADLRAGEQVLDVAAGSGNTTMAAARRYARVTSTDLVAALLDKGRERARAEALPANFQIADVEALPFSDASFDVVLSTFGAMYAADATAAAREMRRVLRPGGRIALANWTQKGFVGRLFKLIGTHLPGPRGLVWPARWGTPGGLAAMFEVAPAQMHFRRCHFHFRYRSAAHWVQVFRDFHGPTHRVFAALDAQGQMALERDMTALLEACNTAGANSLVVPAEYLEAVITPSAPSETAHTPTPH